MKDVCRLNSRFTSTTSTQIESDSTKSSKTRSFGFEMLSELAKSNSLVHSF